MIRQVARMPLEMREKMIGSFLALLLPFILFANKAKAETVPYNFRVYSNFANVSELSNYDDVQSSGYLISPEGSVRFSDGNDVPRGYKLWFLDQGERCKKWENEISFIPDRQVIGVVETLDGEYKFRDDDKFMYGDRNYTPGFDEGALWGEKEVGTPGEKITIIAQSPDNKFYKSHFINGELLDWGYIIPIDEKLPNDIVVENPHEIYNPSHGMFDLADFTSWWLADDCKDIEKWNLIDPNLCYCAEFDTDWDGDIDFFDYADFAARWEPNDVNEVSSVGAAHIHGFPEGLGSNPGGYSLTLTPGGDGAEQLYENTIPFNKGCDCRGDMKLQEMPSLNAIRVGDKGRISADLAA